MSLRVVLVDREGVAPWAGAMRAMEEEIRYPIADGADHFFIDLGRVTTRSSPRSAR